MTRASKPLCARTLRAVADELRESAAWFLQRSDKDWAGDALINDDCVRAEILRMKAKRFRSRATRIERQRKASKP